MSHGVAMRLCGPVDVAGDAMVMVAALSVVLALVACVQYRIYVRAVERYRKAVGDHAQVIEYAAAIRPGRRERPPDEPGASP